MIDRSDPEFVKVTTCIANPSFCTGQIMSNKDNALQNWDETDSRRIHDNDTGAVVRMSTMEIEAGGNPDF